MCDWRRTMCTYLWLAPYNVYLFVTGAVQCVPICDWRCTMCTYLWLAPYNVYLFVNGAVQCVLICVLRSITRDTDQLYLMTCEQHMQVTCCVLTSVLASVFYVLCTVFLCLFFVFLYDSRSKYAWWLMISTNYVEPRAQHHHINELFIFVFLCVNSLFYFGYILFPV